MTTPGRGSPTTGAPTIGVDLGGTNVRVALVERDGRVTVERRAATAAAWPTLAEGVAALVDELLDGEPRAAAVGVGAAGLVDRNGTVHYAPNIPRLVRAPMRAALEDVLTIPVVVDNDANAAAWGELHHGAARGVQHGLVITLGTGVGGGIIANGEVYRGAHGFAGEVGHWQFDPHGPKCACGERGHWEASASGTALGQLARARAGGGDAPNVLARAGGDVSAVNGLHAGASAVAGEPDGREILAMYSEHVALGFAGLANILDPEIVVVSGGLAELGDFLFEPLRAAFRGHLEGAAYRPELAIVAAELGESAGVIGAGVMARALVGG